MKLSKLLLLFLVFISLLLLNNCEAVTEQNDECEKTKWEEVEEPVIELDGSISHTQKFGSTNISSTLDTAHHIEIVGSIQKYYCNGTPSGKFDFTTNYYPDPDPFGGWYYIRLGQAYQFKFQNDKGHLRVNLKWKIYFNYGLTYESKALAKDFYYKDIGFDWEPTIIYDCHEDELNWVKVSGG